MPRTLALTKVVAKESDCTFTIVWFPIDTVARDVPEATTKMIVILLFCFDSAAFFVKVEETGDELVVIGVCVEREFPRVLIRFLLNGQRKYQEYRRQNHRGFRRSNVRSFAFSPGFSSRVVRT
jgi:hypothetical protein